VVLDARSRHVRAAERLWDWHGAHGGPLAAGTSRLAAGLARRLLARRVAGRGPAPPAPWILSVGNLRLGGTGKTPLAIGLAEALGAAGRRGAVVTRGYGGTAAGPLLVTPDRGEAGDEARLMAARLPGWRVVQAADRRRGLAAARALDPAPEVILLEDAYQSAAAPRHLDLLILDRWRRAGARIEPLTGHVLPWGPYREDARGARRADLWLLETDEVLPAEAWGEGDAGPVPVLGFRRRTSLPEGAAPGPDEAYGVCSGIARPADFEAACADLTGRAPAWAVRFDDHARHDERTLALLRAACRRHGGRRLLTTEKDWVKLRPLWRDMPLSCHPVRLDLVWGTPALPDWVGERLARLDREAGGPAAR
jgi:tetraacyldisaccharide 4'-kinase